MSLPNTHHSPEQIGQILSTRKRLWFIGIGGIHMCALAQIALARGFTVAGSDTAENENVQALRAAGITVFPGHAAAQMTGFDAVIYTLAIHADNPEYTAARRLSLPLFSRADFLGYLLHDHATRIGIAGSHGKSTVTAMLGQIFTAAKKSPTVICGARMRHANAPYTIGEGPVCIYEACEYNNSFLHLPPTLAVVLNAELDHVDFFKDHRMLLDAFAQFAAPSTAAVLPCSDTVLQAALSACRRIYTFGTAPNADFRAEDLTLKNGMGQFTLVLQGNVTGRLTLRVPGLHNVSNALAAAAAAHLSGITSADILTGLADFRGAARRMEYRGIFCGARVFDDYAHHPTEIAASVSAARALCGRGRLFVVFQSHTYSRTAAFFDEIAAALSTVDRVLITDIYPARETDTLGVSAVALATATGQHATYVKTLASATEMLLRELQPNDLLIVMGAGDVARIFAHFSKKHFTT